MARIRTIKPTHWSDKELPKISLQAHLLWIATWNFSDDRGIFEADPLLIKSNIFPRRTDIRVDQINIWLGQLVKARFIIPFEFDGEGYYISRTFEAHQRIDKPQPSKIPVEAILEAFQEYSKNVPGTVVPVEYSIVEESNGSGAIGDPSARTPEEKEAFDKLVEWVKEKAPRVLKMKEPLTIEQYMKLKDRFHKELIGKILLAMHNWGDLKKRTSAYLTFLRFAEKEQENAA